MIKTKYRVIVFDWESTLAEDLIGHMIYAIEKQAALLHIEMPDKNTIRDSLDLGLSRVISNIFSQLSMHQQEELLKTIQESVSKPLSYVCLMPGALDLVQELHSSGVDLAIATNKGHHSLQQVLLLSGLDEFFKVTCCASEFPAKPCPDMLAAIENEFGVTKQEMLMIGDSEVDIEMATLFGIDSIGFDAYHKNIDELYKSGALTVLDSFFKVANFLSLP